MICAESVPPTVTRDESRCRGAHDAGAAGMALSDGYFGFFDGDFAAVVAAFATNGVVDVPCAVGADSQCGGYGFVMCSAFCSAGFGLFAFRMCHFSLLLFRDLLQFRGHVSFRQTWSRVKKLCKGRQYLPLCQELNRKTFRRRINKDRAGGYRGSGASRNTTGVHVRGDRQTDPATPGLWVQRRKVSSDANARRQKLN